MTRIDPHRMQRLVTAFERAVAGGEGDVLNSPGPAGMVVFFQGLDHVLVEADISTVYTQNEWSCDRSLSLEDVKRMARDLELEEDLDDDAGHIQVEVTTKTPTASKSKYPQ